MEQRLSVVTSSKDGECICIPAGVQGGSIRPIAVACCASDVRPPAARAFEFRRENERFVYKLISILDASVY
ncbi:unnamed protein product [Leptosia nina]|uniref:Uncharacterized protein n=1 Tax=Leptosia nina TaxID=320188 RepID=A0AAV1JG34_9NEOP